MNPLQPVARQRVPRVHAKSVSVHLGSRILFGADSIDSCAEQCDNTSARGIAVSRVSEAKPYLLRLLPGHFSVPFSSSSSPSSSCSPTLSSRPFLGDSPFSNQS